jgi:cold shock CspA family protein
LSVAPQDTATSEPAKLSVAGLSAYALSSIPACDFDGSQSSSADLSIDLAANPQSASGCGHTTSNSATNTNIADRGEDSFAFSDSHQPDYYLVDPFKQQEGQQLEQKEAAHSNRQDAPLEVLTSQQAGAGFQGSAVPGTSGFFRRTIGQQQATYPIVPREPFSSNLNGSGPGSASGTPVSLGSLTTSTSLADSTSSSPSLSYSMGDISLMSHQPASSFRQQGLGGHYQSASLSPPPSLGQFNGSGISANRKTSSSIFDAFAPLGPTPQHDSPSSHASNPPGPSPAATKQAMRANHPNAPFERAGVDALTQQLAGTSIGAPSNMYSRRSGVVKFFNSTKGERCPTCGNLIHAAKLLSTGFGFVWDNASHEIGDVDIFVHWTTVQGDASFKSLAEGEMVEYELGRGPKVICSST